MVDQSSHSPIEILHEKCHQDGVRVQSLKRYEITDSQRKEIRNNIFSTLKVKEEIIFASLSRIVSGKSFSRRGSGHLSE